MPKNQYKTNNRCVNCDKLIMDISKRCHKCNYKIMEKPIYTNYCVDCSKNISRYALRCTVCSKKGKQNGMYKKTHNEKTRKFLSDINKKNILDKNSNWKGGEIITYYGYVKKLIHNHPFSDRDGYVFKHRLIMEEYLGRFLRPEEIVHHIDGNKLNNSLKNLKLFENESEHQKFHLEVNRKLRRENENKYQYTYA